MSFLFQVKLGPPFLTYHKPSPSLPRVIHHMPSFGLLLRTVFLFVTFLSVYGSPNNYARHLATYSSDEESCKVVPPSTLAVYDYSGNEGLIVFLHEHSLRLYSRGVRPVVMKCPAIKKTRLVLTNKFGERVFTLGPKDYALHLWYQLVQVLPKPNFVSLEEESFNELMPNRKKYCVAVLRHMTLAQTAHTVEQWTKDDPDTGFGVIWYRKSKDHEILRQLGHTENDADSLYCYNAFGSSIEFRYIGLLNESGDILES